MEREMETDQFLLVFTLHEPAHLTDTYDIHGLAEMQVITTQTLSLSKSSLDASNLVWNQRLN